MRFGRIIIAALTGIGAASAIVAAADRQTDIAAGERSNSIPHGKTPATTRWSNAHSSSMPVDHPESRAINDAVRQIRTALPADWSVREVQPEKSPFYLAEGKGVRVEISSSRQRSADAKPECAIYLMPLTYDDGGTNGLKPGEQQTYPPKLIATTSNFKIYLWGGWPEAEHDLLKALAIRHDEH